MKVIIERAPGTTSGEDRVSIQVESDGGDSPEDVAHAFVVVQEIIKGEQD